MDFFNVSIFVSYPIFRSVRATTLYMLDIFKATLQLDATRVMPAIRISVPRRSLCSRCSLLRPRLSSLRPWANRALQRPFHKGSAMKRKLVTKKELRSTYGIPYCPAHIARLEAAGQFPKRVQLGACRVAWVAEEVEQWIDVRIASRDHSSPSE